jgi:hypothetical protein
MVIGFPYGDVVENENTISRDNGNFRWISTASVRQMVAVRVLIGKV